MEKADNREHARGVLFSDASDLCAPMTARHSWMLHAGTLEASQAEALPALTLCVEALTSLPLQLQRAIGIDLRVPSSVMATEESTATLGKTSCQQWDALSLFVSP